MQNSTTDQVICLTAPERISRLRGRARALGMHFLRDESGQFFAWVAVLMMFVFTCMAALSLDIGHMIYVMRQVQASTDAAALAGAQHLADQQYATYAANYSDTGKNTFAGGVKFISQKITPLCLTSIKQPPFNFPCGTAGDLAYNAVQVTETVTVNTFFGGFLGKGHGTMTVSAASTAAEQAAKWNVAIILDTTPSMGDPDSSCGFGATQLSCAEGGISKMLAGLDPNTDNVAMFTFPAIVYSGSSTNGDDNCSAQNPLVAPYTAPSTTGTTYSNTSTPYINGKSTTYSTYEVTPFTNQFQVANSPLQIAVGNGKCAGMQTSMEYTYLAGAIYAAQDALLGEQASLESQDIPSQNAMIILSDGNATAEETDPGGAFSALSNDFLSTSAQVGSGGIVATASGNYPSWVGQCGQEVAAAQAATNTPNNPTRVYTVAYGSPTTSNTQGFGNCGSDVGKGSHPNITPCQAMQQMASSPADMYADGMGTSGCQPLVAGNTPITDLQGIFNAITGSLRYARLIPNNTN